MKRAKNSLPRLFRGVLTDMKGTKGHTCPWLASSGGEQKLAPDNLDDTLRRVLLGMTHREAKSGSAVPQFGGRESDVGPGAEQGAEFHSDADHSSRGRTASSDAEAPLFRVEGASIGGTSNAEGLTRADLQGLLDLLDRWDRQEPASATKPVLAFFSAETQTRIIAA
jgi:hypothetical protein